VFSRNFFFFLLKNVRYARLAREEGHRVTIVSPDKDMMQLVRGTQVVLFDPGKRMMYDEGRRVFVS